MSNNELHVIFGTGPLGKSTMRELLRLGKHVRMINRSGRADVPPGVEVVAGNAYDLNSTTALTRGAAAVYQCAQPEYHEWAEKFPALQTAILEGAAANGAKLIVGDNLYCYGDPDGRPITEDSPQHPHTKKGKVRKAMADAVLEAHRAGKIRAAIGRASNFLGEYDLVGEMVFYPALAGKKPNLLGSLDAPHSFSDVGDFGKGLATLGTRDESLGQAWITPVTKAITQRELMNLLFAEIGLPPKMSALSPLMVRIGGLFSPGARETVEMMYEWQKPFIVDSSKFTRAFGIEATPIETIIRESIAYFRAHPKSA